MTEERIKEIWEKGNEEEIKELDNQLRKGANDTFRIIVRSERMLKYYWKNHVKEDGYFFHPTQYKFHRGDGTEVTYILEGIRCEK